MSLPTRNAINASIERYHHERAGEYERVYEKPERQHDIAELAALTVETFSGKRVLELAAGTGHRFGVARTSRTAPS